MSYRPHQFYEEHLNMYQDLQGHISVSHGMHTLNSNILISFGRITIIEQHLLLSIFIGLIVQLVCLLYKNAQPPYGRPCNNKSLSHGWQCDITPTRV